MSSKYNDKKCAPGIKYTDGSCFTDKSLKKIASEYNKKYGSDKINPNLPREELIKKFNESFKDICNDQRCWIVKAIND